MDAVSEDNPANSADADAQGLGNDANVDVAPAGSSLLIENFFSASVDWQPPDAGPTLLTTQISTRGANRFVVAVTVFAAPHADTPPLPHPRAPLPSGPPPKI